jgi:glycolate oxidase iron-sulfur subunit
VSGLQGFARKTGLIKLLPGRLGELEPQTPVIRAKFSHQLIKSVEAARDAKRYRVAVLTGCVQDLIFSEINRATVDVLIENGCEVFTPPVQPCCGSLHAHNGDVDSARELARRQLDLIDPFQVDAVISNAGGCGSHLRHYGHLLADDPVYAGKAKEWSRKLKDIHEWLVEIGFRRPRAPEEHPTSNSQHPTSNADQTKPKSGTSMLDVGCSKLGVRDKSAPTALTYHESCHLCHGQKVSGPPREILRALPGFELRECAEATWCCGSAGIYNITQPETAGWLQERKTAHVRATGATVVATANPGCHLQLENGLKQAGDTTTVVLHPVVLLARAYAAERKDGD